MLTNVSLDADGAPEYPAEVIDHWNGWAVPLLTRDTMVRVLADLAQEGYTFNWIGDTVGVWFDGEQLDTFAPRPDGRYDMGGWCWIDE